MHTRRRRMQKKPPSTEVLETRIVRASTRSLPKDTGRIEGGRGKGIKSGTKGKKGEKGRGVERGEGGRGERVSEFRQWSRSRFELSNKKGFVFFS